MAIDIVGAVVIILAAFLTDKASEKWKKLCWWLFIVLVAVQTGLTIEAKRESESKTANAETLAKEAQAIEVDNSKQVRGILEKLNVVTSRPTESNGQKRAATNLQESIIQLVRMRARRIINNLQTYQDAYNGEEKRNSQWTWIPQGPLHRGACARLGSRFEEREPEIVAVRDDLLGYINHLPLRDMGIDWYGQIKRNQLNALSFMDECFAAPRVLDDLKLLMTAFDADYPMQHPEP